MVAEQELRKPSLRWGVEQRLEFIEFRLFWEGRMNRHDLMNTFGVSVNQASADLNRYLALAPENMIYNRSARAYLRSPVFTPLFLRLGADRYLNQLRLITEGVLDRVDSLIKVFPDWDCAPAPTRLVQPETLQIVLEAIRDRHAMEIRYQSLSKPEPRWRWITPHALGFDGFRWHLRAHCEESDGFKDFLLARVIETRSTRPRTCDPTADRDWHTRTELVIVPHPGLTDAQRRVVATDYGMTDARVRIRVRRALLFYTLKRLGLEDGHEDRDPQIQQIVLVNRAEVLQGSMPGDDREKA